MAKIEEDGDIIAVLITGKGKSFCAGFDFDELQNPDHKQIEAVMESSRKFHAALTNFPKPMVAVVDGPYMAGGLDLTVMCDIRIASEMAILGHPELRKKIYNT